MNNKNKVFLLLPQHLIKSYWVWSNDMYWSAEHRVVVNSQRERFSMPFFFFPSQYVDIKLLDELINEQNLAKYKEFNWGKFFASRNRSDYKKREVENIQIDHFKGFDEAGVIYTWKVA